ncbi:MAG TPA: hypothetical protein VMM18_13370 [Gemmatimonadaceae bacterium]|nr:hypothetical protein [Gemmatimonadaceae bacterium]
MSILGKLFGQPDRGADDVYGNLRRRVLAIRPGDMGLPPSQPDSIFGIVTETGMDGAVATFACLADGTVSLYLSTGGGVIGAGQHDSVRAASTELLSITNEYAADFIGACSPGVRPTLPPNGRVHFYLLTHSGVYSADCDEEALAAHEDPFASLFGNCHAVLAEVREIEQTRDQ